MPIFKLRILCLKKQSPHTFKTERYQLVRACLAAQDYFLSGNYLKNKNMKLKPSSMYETPEYLELQKIYNLDFFNDWPHTYFTKRNPNSVIHYLVYSLTVDFENDIKNGITDKSGEILTTDRSILERSEIIGELHNDDVWVNPNDSIYDLTDKELKYVSKTR